MNQWFREAQLFLLQESEKFLLCVFSRMPSVMEQIIILKNIHVKYVIV
jgi:hypothetical protein